MKYDEVHKTSVPHDRLTYLCDEMTKAIEREENKDVKGIVMLHDEDDGGISIFGYNKDGEDGTSEAVADLLIHIGALFKAMDKQFMVVTNDGKIIYDTDNPPADDPVSV